MASDRFVTLRPETFYNSEREGAISGYHPRVFTISPPRTDVMLRLRINFALKQLRESGRPGAFPGGIQVDSESLEIFLEMLAANLSSNEPLSRLLDNLAGGNMRLALQFVTDFIGSGHIDTQKIIDKQRTHRYTVPTHEFLRSIMFGDHRYYDPGLFPHPNRFGSHGRIQRSISSSRCCWHTSRRQVRWIRSTATCRARLSTKTFRMSATSQTKSRRLSSSRCDID